MSFLSRVQDPEVIVIGAGLAGSEAAWQAAERGVRVALHEMRPTRMTPVHTTALMAELVCSNSLGSDLPDRALGMLKHELRMLGSLVLRCADETAVPAGGALAVARTEFAELVTRSIEGHPNITVLRDEVKQLPTGRVVVVATGPMTSDALAREIGDLAGEGYLYFYDAVAPIVSAESIDMSVAFRANRYGRSASAGLGSSVGRHDEGDYINCPLNQDEYYALVRCIQEARKTLPEEHEMGADRERFFEACMPIEVLAARHPNALAFGPMRPVGLRDPRTGKRPFAVVQLRQDDAADTLYNLVGFQTNMRYCDQERILRMIPGLEQAHFVRFGQMHRNTYINSPRLLRSTLQWYDQDELLFAGQLTGTEGYVGAIAGGLLAGMNAVRIVRGLPAVALPPTTMMGALFHYITHADAAGFQPMKANFGLLPGPPTTVREKRARIEASLARGRSDLDLFMRSLDCA